MKNYQDRFDALVKRFVEDATKMARESAIEMVLSSFGGVNTLTVSPSDVRKAVAKPVVKTKKRKQTKRRRQSDATKAWFLRNKQKHPLTAADKLWLKKYAEKHPYKKKQKVK